MFRGTISFSLVWLMMGAVSTAAEQPTSRPAEALPANIVAKGPLVLHLPGIGGYRWCDQTLMSGLRDGGVNARLVVYDWTEHDSGIHALQAYQRNQKEAQKIAEMIAGHARAGENSPTYLTAHSGGCALAIWALEKLPPDVKVQTVVLMAPALSPKYDLSAALRHVSGKMYAFTSTRDVAVLYTGTRMFGTMDGVQSEAAGYSGFVRPANGDAKMYEKLVQEPYEGDWARYRDYGSHIGAMSQPFAAAVIAPLIGVRSSAGATTQADGG